MCLYYWMITPLIIITHGTTMECVKEINTLGPRVRIDYLEDQMFLNCKTGQFSGTERGFGILKIPHGQVFSDESTLFGLECVIYMRTSVNKRMLNVIIDLF